MIERVSTASHGGFRVNPAYQQYVPDAGGFSREWFEEDSAWAIAWVALLPLLESRRGEMPLWYRENFEMLTEGAEGMVEDYYPDVRFYPFD